jgi:hypothetical protein
METPPARNRGRRHLQPATVVVALAISGCGWISLGTHALGYPVTGAGEAGNVVVDGPVAYVSVAQHGLSIVDARTGAERGTVPPAAPSDSVDDLAVADGLLFVLDARPPGHLSVYSLADPVAPELRSGPVEVPVGPFSGVSAAAGRVIVSGGTSELTLRTYNARGRLAPEVVRADFGRGQPDVLLAPDGRRAVVSTHASGPHFGLTTVRVAGSPPAIARAGTMALDTIGFTAGGAQPANFPIEAALSGDLLLVAYERGLALVDVADLDRPRLVGECPLAMAAVNVDARDGMAAVVGSRPKPMLALVDVSAPAAPTVIRTVPLPEGTYATGVAMTPTHVVVAAGPRGALVFPR